ncbi:MAG: Zn-ribbon domain-containing OB-fold protein [Candidatus Thorarchaeota archaeon]|nr:Zn-ribbon domain-containing OB-fold protein [Candidatus Thorarchaeota archaeon]
MSEKPSVEAYLNNIQDGHFKAYKCVDCGMVIAPPSGSCYGCGSSNMSWTEVSGKGKLIAFTVIHIAPDEFAEEVPYYVAIVELAEGTRVSARLLGYDPLKPEDVKIGIDVKLDYEMGKSGRNYLAFRPI